MGEITLGREKRDRLQVKLELETMTPRLVGARILANNKAVSEVNSNCRLRLSSGSQPAALPQRKKQNWRPVSPFKIKGER